MLSYDQLVELVNQGVIKIEDYDQINAASIDLTLGSEIMVEEDSDKVISLKERNPLPMRKVNISGGYYDMQPGEAILAHTVEKFYLPNNVSGLYVLKSSMARIFLNHCNAGFADAGWNNSVLTLELINQTRFHRIRLDDGVRIGQMLFFQHKHVPTDKSYKVRGRYNGDNSVQHIKV
jgi:dCTP deaminase